MKVKEIMTEKPIAIAPEETAAVAARTLAYYNIGVIPVCRPGGKLCGILTDRDLTVRCLAAGKDPAGMKVRQIMTGQVVSVSPELEAGAAAALMGLKQLKRLPVCENGKILGMLSLGDLARIPQEEDHAILALQGITAHILG